MRPALSLQNQSRLSKARGGAGCGSGQGQPTCEHAGGRARTGPAQCPASPSAGPVLFVPPWPEAWQGQREGGDGAGWFYFLRFADEEPGACPTPQWRGDQDQH